MSTDGSWKARRSPCWFLAARGQGRSSMTINFDRKAKEHIALITLSYLMWHTIKLHWKKNDILLVPAGHPTAIKHLISHSQSSVIHRLINLATHLFSVLFFLLKVQTSWMQAAPNVCPLKQALAFFWKLKTNLWHQMELKDSYTVQSQFICPIKCVLKRISLRPSICPPSHPFFTLYYQFLLDS